MRQPKRGLSVVVTMMCAISLLIVAPAFALGDAENNSGPGRAVLHEDGNNGDSAENKKTDKQMMSNSDDTINDASQDKDSVRDRTRQLLDDKRKNVKQRTVETRQRACENRRDGINKRYDTFGTAAARHLGRLDDIFAKVKSYQQVKRLSVPDYNQLVTAATANQSAATAAVTALDTGTVDIDCSAADPAAGVAAAKTSLKDTRMVLRDYRQSLKDLVRVLHDANKDQAGNDNGGARKEINEN